MFSLLHFLTFLHSTAPLLFFVLSLTWKPFSLLLSWILCYVCLQHILEMIMFTSMGSLPYSNYYNFERYIYVPPTLPLRSQPVLIVFFKSSQKSSPLRCLSKWALQKAFISGLDQIMLKLHVNFCNYYSKPLYYKKKKESSPNHFGLLQNQTLQVLHLI